MIKHPWRPGRATEWGSYLRMHSKFHLFLFAQCVRYINADIIFIQIHGVTMLLLKKSKVSCEESDRSSLPCHRECPHSYLLPWKERVKLYVTRGGCVVTYKHCWNVFVEAKEKLNRCISRKENNDVCNFRWRKRRYQSGCFDESLCRDGFFVEETNERTRASRLILIL